MSRLKRIISSITKFIAITLLADLGMFIAASIFCFTRSACIGPMWSEFMFWISMAALIAGMPAVIASLSSSKGYFDNPLTAGQDMQVAGTIIQHERQELSKRTVYTIRMFSIGAVGMGLSALIDLMTRVK